MANLFNYQGTGNLWDDVVMPPTAINPIGPDGAMAEDTTDILGSYIAAAAGTPSCVALFQIPHTYAIGTTLHFHVHWVKNDDADNAGAVIWEAKWRISPLNSAMGAYNDYAAGTLTVDPADIRYHHAKTVWEIPATGVSLSTIIAISLRRNGGTSGSVNLIGLDIHIQKAQHGSAIEYSLT